MEGLANSLTKIISSLKNLLIYEPPSIPTPFVLEEKQSENESEKPAESSALTESADELNQLLRFAQHLEATIEQAKSAISQEPTPDKIDSILQQIKVLEAQKAELSPILLAYNSGENTESRNISASLEENSLIIKKIFQVSDNEDIIIRDFFIPTNPPRKAMLVFTQGLVDNKDITSSILMPLFAVKELSGDILEFLITKHLSSNQAKQVKDFQAIVKGINGGDTALFVDGANGAILLFTKGFEHRAIGRPQLEQTIRGSQSAFTETLRTNITLVRLTLRSPNLVTKMITLGKRSRIDCAVMYLQSVANPDLVAEVKRRLSNISTDNITAGMLEQFIEDHPGIPFPQILSTERPDRVSSHLSEGRIAVLVDGDPFALVVPISLFTLFGSPEDFALKLPSGTFMRALRYLSAFVAVILPAFYLAITYYHQEAVPTDLILAIAGARERIPFPAIVEVLFIEVSFEFIREAGTRIPGLLGQTLGIVGGIILGQAVVAASLISPVTVVVVAITAIASFSIPDFRMGMAVRQIRFLFIIAGATLGLIGVASGLFVVLGVLSSMKSFGVPYLSPIAPKTTPGLDTMVRGPVYRQEQRPDELNTQDQSRQPPISRKWEKQRTEGGNVTDELSTR